MRSEIPGCVIKFQEFKFSMIMEIARIQEAQTLVVQTFSGVVHNTGAFLNVLAPRGTEAGTGDAVPALILF